MSGIPRGGVGASRRRRFLGSLGGGLVGSGLAALAVAGLNLWLCKPPGMVWSGLVFGMPTTLAGAWMILRIAD